MCIAALVWFEVMRWPQVLAADGLGVTGLEIGR